MPLSRLRTRPQAFAALAALLGAGLVIAVAPGASAEPGEPLDLTLPGGPSDAYAISLQRITGGEDLGWGFGESATSSYLEVTIRNLATAPQEFGLAADLDEAGLVERLWLEATWASATGSENTDPAAIGSFFRKAVEPQNEIVVQIPDWPGKAYEIYRLDDGDGPLAEPELVGSYTNSGVFVPVNIDLTADTVEVGRLAHVSGNQFFPGATATVTAAGLTPGKAVDLWMAPQLDYIAFMILGARLPDGSVHVGQGIVDSAGALSAPFVLPSNTDPGRYQLMLGDPVTRDWPAGTAESFEVTEIPETSVVGTPTGTDVAVSVQFDTATVGLTFPAVSAAGDTTVVSSATGPVASAFTLALTPQRYFHIDTTADHATPVEVCITYNPAEAPEMVDLFHATVTRDADGVPISSQWRNITTSRAPGVVCGLTDSFSPFTLGVPTDPKDKKEQCKKGGWRVSTAPVFHSQGACVSHYAKSR